MPTTRFFASCPRLIGRHGTLYYAKPITASGRGEEEGEATSGRGRRAERRRRNGASQGRAHRAEMAVMKWDRMPDLKKDKYYRAKPKKKKIKIK